MASASVAFCLLLVVFAYITLNHEFQPATKEYCVLAKQSIHSAVVVDADNEDRLRVDELLQTSGRVVNVFANSLDNVSFGFDLYQDDGEMFEGLSHVEPVFTDFKELLQELRTEHLTMSSQQCENHFFADRAGAFLKVAATSVQVGRYRMPLMEEHHYRWNYTVDDSKDARLCERTLTSTFLRYIRHPEKEGVTRTVKVDCSLDVPEVTILQEAGVGTKIAAGECDEGSAKLAFFLDGFTLHNRIELFGRVEESVTTVEEVILKPWWTPEMAEYCAADFNPVVIVADFKHNAELAFQADAWMDTRQHWLKTTRTVLESLLVAVVWATGGLWLWMLAVTFIMKFLHMIHPATDTKLKVA